MTVEEAISEDPVATDDGQPEDDGRTRCAWVRGYPAHYLFHDAEWGRLPDSDEGCFERVLLTCVQSDTDLVLALDQRAEIFEATDSWNAEAVAGASDEDLEALMERGGIFASMERLKRFRDVAGQVVAVSKEFKGLRKYFLVMPAFAPEDALADIQARLPALDKVDAANLLEMVGCIGGSDEAASHERDCWIA